MATWKKVLVSGSSAELSALKVDNLTSGSVVIGGGVSGSLFSKAINGQGDILATSGSVGAQMVSASISGSFTGSFFGDGSGLTNLSVNGTRIGTGSVSASVDVTGKIFSVESSSIELFTLGAESASFGVGVTASAGFYGTASWSEKTQTAISSSYPFDITGSTVYTNTGEKGQFSTNNSFIVGVNAGTSASNANSSNFIGPNAGYDATNANNSNFIGDGAGYSASFANNSNFLGIAAGYEATNANNSNFLGNSAGYQATNVINSNFLGNQAGNGAINSSNSNFLGNQAGNGATNANSSNFLGDSAGYQAVSASYSNFLGNRAGYEASSASYSNFLGNDAGYSATNAVNSNFIGNSAGISATSASYSTLIGYQVGYNAGGGALGIKSNNIIIGTNITLEDGRRDSINLGGLIFGTGSYSDINVQSSSPADGRIGINQSLPEYTLDVSGVGRYTQGLIVSGTLIAPDITGSLFGTASWAKNAISSSYISGSGTGSFTGSFYGMFSGSAALQYTASSGLGISTFKYNGSENVKVEISGAATLSNDTLVMWKTGSGVFANSSISEGTQGVFIDNALGVVIEQGGIAVSGSSTFHNNLLVQGDLTVAGTASFQNTTNLAIADQFILLSSGSSTFQDSGLIVNGGSNQSGSALFLETNSTGENGRWAVQANLNVDATTATPDQYVVTAKIDGVPTADPTWGGATNGRGNMWIDTGSGDIYIWS